MPVQHIDDHDLERYHLGMVTEEAEQATIEEHLLWCHACVDRMETTARYIDALRAGAVLGGFDLELPPGGDKKES